MLNERRQRVLRLLLAADQPLAASAIGRTLGCPARSVRYDLEAVGDWVKRYGANLIGIAGAGYHLSGDLGQLREALQSLARREGPVYEYVLSPRERVRRQLLHLLGCEGSLSLQHLADRLGVGKSTVHADLFAADAWATARGLTLERSTVGVSLTGLEPLYQQAMADLIMELADEGQLAMLLDGHPDAEPLQRLLRPMLPHVDWLALGSALREAHSPELTVHLIVMVSRVAHGRSLTYNPELVDRVTGTEAWHRTQALANLVSRVCHINLPTTERASLTLISQMARAEAEKNDTASLSEADLATARSLVSMVQTRLGVPLLEDQEFVLGLALHLRPIQMRLLRGLTVENPLLVEVRSTYPAAFRAAEDVGRVLAGKWRVAVPEAEVGYLAILIAAAMERARITYRHQIRALLVCGAGIGTAQLLASRLRTQQPDIQVVRITSAFRVKEALACERYDLVISTCQLPESDTPVAQVSPFLTAEDLARIQVVLRTAHIQPGGGRQPVLEDLFTEATIALDVEAENWEEAVRAAGDLLVKAGHVEPRYVDAMIDTARKLGPYIVLGPGFALPHSRPEDGVIRLGMALVRLRSPIAFGHPDNDPVDLVIALGAVDHEAHLLALMQLSELLGDPNSLAALRSAGDIPTVLVLIHSLSAQLQPDDEQGGVRK